MWLFAGILTLQVTLVSSKGCTGRFMRFTNSLLHNVCEPHDYFSAANVLNLALLAEHKRSAEISFSNGFLINKVDSSSLRFVIRFFSVQHVNQPFHLLFLLPLPTNYFTRATKPFDGYNV